MEWFESRFDDSLFDSMLSPVVKQAMERIFQFPSSSSSSRESFGCLSAFFLFHNELGIVLQNDASRKMFPKAIPNFSLETLLDNLEGALLQAARLAFRSESRVPSHFVQGVWPLQADRIPNARSLYFLKTSFPWGKLIFLRTGPTGTGEAFEEHFKEKEHQIDDFLRPLLDRWAMDATLEVFWSRLLINTPSGFQPKEKGTPSPLWTRKVSFQLQSNPGEEAEICLEGDYYYNPGDGWKRVMRKSDALLKKRMKALSRAGPGEDGRSIEVPVDLWGLIPLGTVCFPKEIVKDFGVPDFLSKLRRARAVSLRSLYLHLLIPGPLEVLKFWIPEAECFSIELLKDLTTLVGDEEILDDTLVKINIMSIGYRLRIEEKLRPGDLVLQEPRNPGRLVLLLRNCSRIQANKSVIPRVLTVEGVTEQSISEVLTLREHLASQGIYPTSKDQNSL